MKNDKTHVLIKVDYLEDLQNNLKIRMEANSRN